MASFKDPTLLVVSIADGRQFLQSGPDPWDVWDFVLRSAGAKLPSLEQGEPCGRFCLGAAFVAGVGGTSATSHVLSFDDALGWTS